MIERRTCFVFCSLLYLMNVDGFPIYGELSVTVSATQKKWEEAKTTCKKDGLQLANYLTVDSLKNINPDLHYWIGGEQENGKCPVLSNKSPTTDGCKEEYYFLCSPQEIADMNHVIMIAVGGFTITNMILVSICVLRRLCKRRARLPKEEKPKVTSKKDKKERKKKDTRQQKDTKVSEDTKEETPATGDAEAPKQTGDDAQTAQTTAVVEAGATGPAATGTADTETTSTTPAATASTTAETEAVKEEKLPDPPEFILNDTSSTATTTVATVSTAASVAVVTSTATAVPTTTGTGDAESAIVSGSITTTDTNVDAAKEADKKDMSCHEADKDDPGKAVVTTSEDKPSLMAEMESLLLGQSTDSKQGEATPINPPLPPPPEEVIKSDTTTET